MDFDLGFFPLRPAAAKRKPSRRGFVVSTRYRTATATLGGSVELNT